MTKFSKTLGLPLVNAGAIAAYEILALGRAPTDPKVLKNVLTAGAVALGVDVLEDNVEYIHDYKEWISPLLYGGICSSIRTNILEDYRVLFISGFSPMVYNTGIYAGMHMGSDYFAEPILRKLNF